MKKLFASVVIAVLATLTLASLPVMAMSLGVSPSHASITVPSGGSASLPVSIYYYTGQVQVSAVNLPVTVTSGVITSTSDPYSTTITVTTNTAPGTYNGYLRFQSVSGSIGLAVNMAVQVDVVLNVTMPPSYGGGGGNGGGDVYVPSAPAMVPEPILTPTPAPVPEPVVPTPAPNPAPAPGVTEPVVVPEPVIVPTPTVLATPPLAPVDEPEPAPTKPVSPIVPPTGIGVWLWASLIAGLVAAGAILWLTVRWWRLHRLS